MFKHQSTQEQIIYEYDHAAAQSGQTSRITTEYATEHEVETGVTRGRKCRDQLKSFRFRNVNDLDRYTADMQRGIHTREMETSGDLKYRVCLQKF